MHYLAESMLHPYTPFVEEQLTPKARNSLAQGHGVKVRWKFDPLQGSWTLPDTPEVSRWTA